MKRALFPSIEAMLSAETLGRLTGSIVPLVSLEAMAPEFGRSGSRIFRVITNEGSSPQLILKRVSFVWDWLMRSTHDTRCRAITLWLSGLFDQMPPEIGHGILACARDDEGWAILMQDVGELLLPFEVFSEADLAFSLRAMAAMHASYWRMEALQDPDLGLCRLEQLYQMFSPRTAQAEAAGENPIPRLVVEGWEKVEATLPEDVVTLLLSLLNDPEPLCSALRRYPHTLIHGDWRHANQAYRSGMPQLYLLDWQLAAAAPPSVELARFLITNSPLLPTSKEEAIAYYRTELAARLGSLFSDEWWEPQLAIGLLGGALQDAWALVLKASHWPVGAAFRPHWREDIPWWVARAREGVDWL